MNEDDGQAGLASQVIIRKACQDDLRSLSELVAGSGSRDKIDGRSPVRTEPDSDAERLNWRRMLGTHDLSVYVAEADGVVVGTVMLMVMPNLGYGGRPTGFVEALKVSEALRRNGIGRLLMDQLLGDARALGCHKIQLLTHKNHAGDGAFDFYRSLAFEPEAEGFRLYLG